MLAAARRIAAADASLRRGEWQRSAFTGIELRGKTLGILGLGRIGLAVADRARGLEMAVVGHDPFVSADVAAAHGITLLETDEVLARADVLTVHVPGGRSTHGLVGARELALMPAGAIVLNVARGGIIDELALTEALRSGHIGAAGIDVFTAEPPRESPLLDAPRTVLTPHLGASTAEAQIRVAVEASQQVVDVLEGRSARYAVNAPLATPDTAPVVAPYLAVAETLGRLRAQLGPLAGEMTLELAGELAEHDAAPLTAAALQGLLEASTEERVNLVNAPSLARARGLTLVERRTADAGRYASLVSLGGGAGGTIVGGTLANGEPRLVRLGEHWLDIAPSEWMLVTRHEDLPGTIGRVGAILGEADVNISAMHVARSLPRADAFMILALDDPVDDAVADRIRGLAAVHELWLVHLA
jgi:D-3-phosphoglycerate dehydrogenase